MSNYLLMAQTRHTKLSLLGFSTRSQDPHNPHTRTTCTSQEQVVSQRQGFNEMMLAMEKGPESERKVNKYINIHRERERERGRQMRGKTWIINEHSQAQ